MKKIIFSLLILSLTLVFNACTIGQNNQGQTVPEEKIIKNIVDISEKDDQDVEVAVGDVLYFKLLGSDQKNYQWNLVSFKAIDFLNLEEHKVSTLDIGEGNFTDEWKLEVMKPGSFEIRLEYGQVNQEPEDTFEVRVVSK